MVFATKKVQKLSFALNPLFRKTVVPVAQPLFKDTVKRFQK